jgi:xylan 1,4-beta-xylosidase
VTESRFELYESFNMKHPIYRSLWTTVALAVSLVASTAHIRAQSAESTVAIEVDLKQTSGPLDHIWSKCVGSDRAAITLREDWRNDLTRFHEEAGIEQVRFHGIFADELGVYTSSLMVKGKQTNWQNVDRVYDGLLKRGVRPFVELSFMPKYLASGSSTFGFYKANITPPTDLAEWGTFIKAFVQHLADRYGIDEVKHWMFEVWNEPNLQFFWTGTQADYFELYKTTVNAIKSIDSKLMVGGPSTAAIQWIPEFLSYCEANALPIDFVSTHIYIGDKQQKIFGKPDAHPPSEVIPAGMTMVRAQIDASKYKGAPLWLSEWSSDSPAMIAHVIKNCMGVCQALSQWTFTNTYEELGVAPFILKEGDNGFGMMAAGSIPKPQFNTYKLLHRLGNTRLVASDGPVLASRRDNGSVALAVWNLAEVMQPGGIPGAAFERKVTGGEPKQFLLTLKGARSGQSVKVSYVDQARGSPFPEWRKLGSPQYLTMAQIETIRKSAELAAPETLKLGKDGELILSLPPECLALIEVDGI